VPTIRFTTELASISTCRYFVREQMAGCSDPVKDVAALLTSELVANAIIEGQAGGEFDLSLGGGALRLEVRYSNRREPIPRSHGIEFLLGEEIIESLSDEWGVEQTRSDKRVWARIDHVSC
jgi:hypothetical protein